MPVPEASTSLVTGAAPDAPQSGHLPPSHTRLPPGMVLGPDGKPCKACNSLRSMRLATRGIANPPAAGASGPSAASSSTAAGAAGLLAGQSEAEDPRRANCPPDSEQLGRSTWTFLHTTAAYYPPSPTPFQRSQMLALLSSLPTLYPCSYCAKHLGEEIKRRPPDVSGREGVSRWLCEVHNEVNERLGKGVFDCSKVLERWKDGPRDGSCD